MQNILVRQLRNVKPVNENDVDNPFDEVERISELYINVVSQDEPMCERWSTVVMMPGLPDKIIQSNVVPLTGTDTIEEILQIAST